MAKKCARTFSIVVEKGKKSILDVGHLLPARTDPPRAPDADPVLVCPVSSECDFDAHGIAEKRG